MLSAIVLAAGTSSRMRGGNKLLLPLAGKTPVQMVVENIVASGMDEVIVVTGHQASQVRQLLQPLPVTLVHNDGYEAGLTGSIQKGVSAARGDGFMICLSDMPFITPADYAQLKAFFEAARQADEACICVPRFGGRPGNPVIFSSFYREEILRHAAADGCKQIVQSHPSHLHHTGLGSDAILKDIDTHEDYLAVLSSGQQDGSANTS